MWNMQTYELVKTVNSGPNLVKLLQCLKNNYVLTAGRDLKLYNSKLHLMHEFIRDNTDNSIRLGILLDKDRIVFASNFDIEIFSCEQNSKLVELKKFIKTHNDTILSLEIISDLIFASGSSDGQVILWLSKNLIRSVELRPFNELNTDSLKSGLNKTSISCIRSYCERYLIIASGQCLSVYDNYNRDYSCKIENAHRCKITDILILK